MTDTGRQLIVVENTCPHSALGDASATAEAFRRLREMYTRTSFAVMGGAQ